jgi:hypothetical protein
MFVDESLFLGYAKCTW